MSETIAGLELGGTKCIAVLAVGGTIQESRSVPTTTPDETLAALEETLDGWARARPFAALGIASFGPLGLDPERADHGRITTTPKPGWAGTDLLGRFAGRYGVPTGFDTDVAAAARAEHLWGGAKGTSSNVYLTIGTGVGGGAIINGRTLHGLLHPEIGHVRVRRAAGDPFPGTCPFHGDCIEGLVSGVAIAARAGRPPAEILPEDPIWTGVVGDLAELLATVVLTLSPQHIALGGGVVNGKPWLFDRLRAATAVRLAGYIALLDDAALHRLVAPATFGANAGPLGAIALGLQALRTE